MGAVASWSAEPWVLPMMRAELSLELAHLGELVGRELGTQSLDRFREILGALAPGNRVVGDMLDERERLSLVVRAALRRLLRALRPLQNSDQRVGEIAPGIELIGADADLGLEHIQSCGEKIAPTLMMEAGAAVWPLPMRPPAVTAGAAGPPLPPGGRGVGGCLPRGRPPRAPRRR